MRRIETAVALRVADAYARTNQSAREFALYDTLLVELAKRADGMPLGALLRQAPSLRNQDNKTPAQYDALSLSRLRPRALTGTSRGWFLEAHPRCVGDLPPVKSTEPGRSGPLRYPRCVS